jgi:MoaA/NifB/PqqE/SkfB family radical SAM enzyme
MYKFNTELIKDSLVESDYPKSVVVETTAFCNLSCSLCPQSTLKRPKGNMDFFLPLRK